MWRNVPRVTDIYPTATPLAVIARDVAESLGLTGAEMLLPASSGYTIHSQRSSRTCPPGTCWRHCINPAAMRPSSMRTGASR